MDFPAAEALEESTVQTSGVCVAMLTTSPSDAVALMAYGLKYICCLRGALKVKYTEFPIALVA
jgi:hypothetical protein